MGQYPGCQPPPSPTHPQQKLISISIAGKVGKEGGTVWIIRVSILKLILTWKFHFKIHFPNDSYSPAYQHLVGGGSATYHRIFCNLYYWTYLVLIKTIKEQFATHLGPRVQRLRESKRAQVCSTWWLWDGDTSWSTANSLPSYFCGPGRDGGSSWPSNHPSGRMITSSIKSNMVAMDNENVLSKSR